MVKLKPEQQRRFVAANPGVFEPVKDGWGRRGATQVRLDGGSARESHLFRACFPKVLDRVAYAGEACPAFPTP